MRGLVVGVAKPKFCPNCGKKMTDNQEISNYSRDGGYDSLCEKCGWSGEIFPDSEYGRYVNEA